MTMTTTCGTCRFSAAALDAKRKIDFTRRICKFMPPTPLLCPNPQNGAPMIQAIFPIMETSQQCGQWQPSPASEPLLPGEAPLEKAEDEAN